jgi:Tfp pilus assembly protein PilZ
MSGPPPLRVSYECAAGGWRESTTARELSLGGIFIETPTMLPIGSLVAMEIESGSTKATVDGRVLSCREKAEGPGAPAGVAVRFIDLPLEVQSALHFIISTRTPRKGTTLGLGEPEEGVEKYESARSLPAAPGVPLRPAGSAPKIPAGAEAEPGPASGPLSVPPELKRRRGPVVVLVLAVLIVLTCIGVLLAR